MEVKREDKSEPRGDRIEYIFPNWQESPMSLCYRIPNLRFDQVTWIQSLLEPLYCSWRTSFVSPRHHCWECRIYQCSTMRYRMREQLVVQRDSALEDEESFGSWLTIEWFDTAKQWKTSSRRDWNISESILSFEIVQLSTWMFHCYRLEPPIAWWTSFVRRIWY